MKNLFNLDGKVIVITGAAGLLGQMHSEAIAAFGGNPILIDLSQGVLNNLSNKLSKKYSVNASGYAVDITNEEAIKENMPGLLARSDSMVESPLLKKLVAT